MRHLVSNTLLFCTKPSIWLKLPSVHWTRLVHSDLRLSKLSSGFLASICNRKEKTVKNRKWNVLSNRVWMICKHNSWDTLLEPTVTKVKVIKAETDIEADVVNNKVAEVVLRLVLTCVVLTIKATIRTGTALRTTSPDSSFLSSNKTLLGNKLLDKLFPTSLLSSYLRLIKLNWQLFLTPTNASSWSVMLSTLLFSLSSEIAQARSLACFLTRTWLI